MPQLLEAKEEMSTSMQRTHKILVLDYEAQEAEEGGTVLKVKSVSLISSPF